MTLIGVVTSGAPLLLLMNFCEHGSMLDLLKQRARNAGVLTRHVAGSKNHMLEMALATDIATGMEHLIAHHFVHRCVLWTQLHPPRTYYATMLESLAHTIIESYCVYSMQSCFTH